MIKIQLWQITVILDSENLYLFLQRHRYLFLQMNLILLVLRMEKDESFIINSLSNFQAYFVAGGIFLRHFFFSCHFSSTFPLHLEIW